MDGSAAKNGPEVLKDAFERSKDNLPKFIDESESLDDLNERSRVLLEKQLVTKSVQKRVHAKLSVLQPKGAPDTPEKIEKSLDTLYQKYESIRALLTYELSNTEKLKGQVNAVQNMVTGRVGELASVVQESALKPIANATKTIPILGPILGMLSEVGADDVKSFVMRRYYQAVASLTGVLGKESFVAKFFRGTVENAEQQLVLLDIKDTVARYQKEKLPGETIKADLQIKPSEWPTIKQLLASDPDAMKKKVMEYVDRLRTAKEGTIAVSVAALLAAPTDPKTLQEQTLIAKAKAVFGAENVILGTVTAFEKTETVLKPDELDIEGKPKKGSNAETLLAVKEKLSNAARVEIVEAGAPLEIEWKNGTLKIVRLPSGSEVSLETINEIVKKPKPEFASIVRLQRSDAVETGELVYKSGDIAVLQVSDEATLKQFAANTSPIDMSKESKRWRWNNVAFT
jgi:hypothetical protein